MELSLHKLKKLLTFQEGTDKASKINKTFLVSFDLFIIFTAVKHTEISCNYLYSTVKHKEIPCDYLSSSRKNREIPYDYLYSAVKHGE